MMMACERGVDSGGQSPQASGGVDHVRVLVEVGVMTAMDVPAEWGCRQGC